MIQTIFVESLYRLYKDNKINKNKLDELLTSKKITQAEYDYIISAKNVIVEVV
jgi:phospholipid N-methyltransferase